MSLVPLQGEISSKENERLWLEKKRLWISSQGEDSTDLGEGESFDTLNPMVVEFHLRKEGMKDQPNYFNKLIQGRTKMLLSYPLQAPILLMILQCHRMTLPRLILRYMILHL